MATDAGDNNTTSAASAEGDAPAGGAGRQTVDAETVEVVFRKVRPKTDPVGRYPGFSPGSEILSAGTVIKPGHRPLTCDILWERDVAVTLRDGTVIYTDVFLPAGGASLPAIGLLEPLRERRGRQPGARRLPLPGGGRQERGV